MFKRFCISVLALILVAFINVTFAASKTILVYGDSLSAAYGLPQQVGWVSLLEKKLQNERYAYRVVNASISGETTSGGLSRLKKVLAETKPDIVILELGANDGLRGLPVKSMNANLVAMIEQMKKAQAKVILAGMRIPPNYGPQYAESFSATYPQLSREYQLTLIPFFLDKVAAQPDLLLQDGLHPNANGQPLLLDNIWPHLKPILKK